MQLFKLKTVIDQFETFADFAKAFALGERDLVITNDFLYEPFMKASQLPCHFVMQEHYGMGEPSEEMMNQILHDLQGTDYDRVIAVGGGTVIDLSLIHICVTCQAKTKRVSRGSRSATCLSKCAKR